jgi:hypothetical protein
MPIVEAVMVGSMDAPLATASGRPKISALIEKAMSDAVATCYAEGELDPVKIKAAMLQAREAVKASLHEERKGE